MPDEKTFPSVWTRPHRGRDQPALSREQIVAEAVRLLDSDGIEALSMRKLGSRLDAGATSLYRHVTHRDELIELVVDAVYGEIDVPDRPGDWRADLVTAAASMRAMILRHPWMATLFGQVGLAYLGPNVMRLNDRLLALVEAAGFAGIEADQAISAIAAYVIGVGVGEAAWLTALARSGQDERAWVETLRPAAETAAKPFPRLHEQLDQWAAQDPAQGREESFRYGLDRLLDGLEPRRAGGGS